MNQSLGEPVAALPTKPISLRARLISAPANRWLASQPRTQILHVFDHSCNLLAANGEILSLIAPEVDPGPFSVVVELPCGHGSSFKQLIDIDDEISFIVAGATGLRVGWLSIGVELAERWDPQIERGLLCQRPVKSRLDQMRNLVTLLAPEECLAFAFESNNETVFQKRINAAWRELKCGISSRDPERCAAGARLAAGVGIGLTPAGDDFLLGVLIALWLGMTGPEHYVDKIANTAAAKTSTLSAAWLTAARVGDVSCVWHDLALALKNDNEESILAASQRVLAIGHTSGADALSGFIVALDLIGRNTDST